MKSSLRIAFFGTPEFATATLKEMHQNGLNIVAVVTAPDRPKGRGLQLEPSDVKKYAIKNDLPLFQPEKMKSPDFVSTYRELNVDLAIVVAFRMMPEIIWNMPKYGTINLHGSLLPQYRGAAPINWAIINGENTTGVTTFFINHEIDKGRIILQKSIDIQKEDNFGTLYYKLMNIGSKLVLETIDRIAEGNLESTPQTFTESDKLAPKITKEILEISDFSSAQKIHNLVRGLVPIYKPYIVRNVKKYILKETDFSIENHPFENGEWITDQKTYLKIACSDGFLLINSIQAEGKKAMDIISFFNGNTLD